ncbi:unnamed protein product [Ilex paraguariensis]|uniref:Uncharacterized protein n=1 Tax=Ilex paraguariensis TaxID=185542 RepID=A0ABC8R4C9_9AQUA
MLKDTMRLYADEISLGSYEINKFYHRSWHDWWLLENDVQVKSNCGTIQQEVGVETDSDGDMNDSDSSDYESFYDSEYDIIDDQLYETFVDKKVEFFGKDKGNGVDKGKGVDSERGTTKDVDNALYAEDYDGEELLSLNGSSLENEEGGHCGSYGKCITKWFKVRRKRNTSCPSARQPQATQPQTTSTQLAWRPPRKTSTPPVLMPPQAGAAQPILPKQTKSALAPTQHSKSAPIPTQHSNSSKKVRKTKNVVGTQ